MGSKSLWIENANSRFPTLVEHGYADTVVVGGGLSGLTTAYYLAKSGMDVAVIEARQIGSGTSGHTTAHITSQHDATYYRYLKRFGAENSLLYAAANQEAISEIYHLIEKEKIECGFQFQDSYLFTVDEDEIEGLLDEEKAAFSLGIPAVISKPDFFLPYKCALKFPHQALFHPVQYMNGLADSIVKYGGRIFENSRVLHLRSNTLITKESSLRAKNVVIATHSPVLNFPGTYFARMYQHRSYVMAFQNAPLPGAMFTSIDKDGHTFRSADNLLVVSGEDHKCGTEKTTNHYSRLETSILSHVPAALPVYQWSAQDGITLDNFPYIGRYSKKTPNLYVATGYGKWGMTQSNIAAHILSDLILGKRNAYAGVFSPQRRMVPAALMNGIYQNAAVAAHYAAGLFQLKNPRCAHLKCGTVWNRDEMSWDCPCHGSRFDEDGRVLDTPAIHGLSGKE